MVNEPDYSQLVMIVGGFSIGATPEDPGHAALRLAASSAGSGFNFRFDAEMLEKLGTALLEAATRLRATAN
jgi:hypothetical protein